MSTLPETATPEGAGEPPANRNKTIVACALILVGAGGLAAIALVTEPTAKRGGATKETAMLVDVIRAEGGTFRPVIVETGTARPAQDVVLRPQVSGVITRRAPEFTPGGFVEKGDSLLGIERADYAHALEQRKSDLRQAVADLEIEMGRQNVAASDYELLGKTLPSNKKALVLREPQLDAARSRVDAARAAVEQAELNLRRTAIAAPFTAHIIERNVNVGSHVSPGDPLGRLVGVNSYWVETTVPLAKLRWLSFPGAPGERGSEVEVRNRAAWPEGLHRTGHLHKKIGALDESTRMARVLVEIPDPLARSSDGPALVVGEFLEVRIRGEAIEDAVRLDREYVRDGDTVWVMEQGTLKIRDVEVTLRDAEHAYVASGLEDGDQVVTTHLSTVSDGAPLRVEPAPEAPAE